MAVDTKTYLTPEQYLAAERVAETKSEYLGGEMIGMTGASRRHGLVAGNVHGLLWQQLKGRPCETFLGDLRVLVAASGLYSYPDVVVVCGEPALTDEHFDTLTNPTVLIEVLSPSTETYDRTTKFEHYRALDSLQEYVLVSQDRPRVEQYLRQEDRNHWLYTEVTDPEGAVVLRSIGCELPMAEIYHKVSFK
jgi:Uma2 family endonuclease